MVRRAAIAIDFAILRMVILLGVNRFVGIRGDIYRCKVIKNMWELVFSLTEFNAGGAKNPLWRGQKWVLAAERVPFMWRKSTFLLQKECLFVGERVSFCCRKSTFLWVGGQLMAAQSMLVLRS